MELTSSGGRAPLTADEVLNARFTSTRWREGYDQDAVDDFLDRVVDTLRSRAEGTLPPTGPLTRADVHAVTFPATRYAEGYDQDEVDDLLDRVADVLAGDPVAPGQPGTTRPARVAGDVPAAVAPQVIHEGSRGLRTWTRDRTAAPGAERPAARRRVTVRGVTEALAYRLVLPACALLMVLVCVDSLPHALAAARGEGVPGTFVAEVEDCGDGGPCSWTGRFLPDDGSPAVPDVLLDDDVPQGVGGRVPALYEGETDPAIVYHAEGDRTWVYLAALLTGALGYLAFGAWWLVRRAARGRRRPDRA